jgi:glycosyltransferase involved in cell wall biosynthesis
MLADEGFAVEVLTVPLSWASVTVQFAHPGVAVRALPVRLGRAAAVLRLVDFVRALVATRRRFAGRPLVEIAYDPAGILYSDLAAFRPATRVAHFHECLQRYTTARIERRLGRTIGKYQALIVPDETRAELLRDQLQLQSRPWVVPNFPLRRAAPKRNAASRDAPFRVVYCGAVGTHQKLDLIIQSVPLWPASAVFSVIGNHVTGIGRELQGLARRLGVEERVAFQGWVSYERLPGLLAESDIAVSLLDPSFEQWRTALGASNKRYQYMQAGLPQIGDMNPRVPELLEGNGIGACLRAYTTEALAEIVSAYAGNPERRAAEGRRAAELHRTRYNYETAFRPVVDWLNGRVSAFAPAQ